MLVKVFKDNEKNKEGKYYKAVKLEQDHKSLLFVLFCLHYVYEKQIRRRNHLDTDAQLKIKNKTVYLICHFNLFLIIIRLLYGEIFGVFDQEIAHKSYNLF